METIEILDPEPYRPRKSKWRKYGPALFWGTMVALPAMNLGASFFDYRTAKLQLELEKLKIAAEQMQDIS